MTRQNFTPKTKAAIRERSGGVCEVHMVPRCMYPALPETCNRTGAEVDHITPDVFDGGNDATNGALLCETCHKTKTYTDNREAKKSNRIRGVTGNGPKRKIESRKMGEKAWKPPGYVSPLSREARRRVLEKRREG